MTFERLRIFLVTASPAIIYFTVFTNEYFYGAVIPLMPFFLGQRFQVPTRDLQTWTSALVATFAASTLVGSPLFGSIANRPRLRKLVFLTSSIFLTFSTCIFALGRQVWMLPIARVFQSFASAIVRCAGFAMLHEFTAIQHKGRTMGLVGTTITAGALLGPICSGFIYNSFGYGEVWFVIGVLIVLSTTGSILLQDPAFQASSGETSTTDSLTDGTDSNENVALLSTSADQDHEPQTMEYVRRLLTNRLHLAAIYFCAIETLLLGVFESALPLFLEETLKRDSVQVSWLLLALYSPLAISVLFGIFSDRYGTKPVAFVGFAIAAAAFPCLGLVTEYSTPQVILLITTLILCGVAISLLGTAGMAGGSTAMAKIEQADKESGIQSNMSSLSFALLHMARAVGQISGPGIAWFSIRTVGWGGLNILIGILCAVSAAFSGLSVLRDFTKNSRRN